MCKYKDTDLGIKKLDFGQKRGMMAVYLTDGRVVLVPSACSRTSKVSAANRERSGWCSTTNISLSRPTAAYTP